MTASAPFDTVDLVAPEKSANRTCFVLKPKPSRELCLSWPRLLVRTILSCRTANFVAPAKVNRRAHAGYRPSRCLKLNNIATTAKTSGQITLASGPTVPPVSHCDPFKVTLKRLCDGVNPLLGTP